MKNVIVKGFTFAEVDAKSEPIGFLKIPAEHKIIRAEGENLEISDGYHTFDELYDHRIALFKALMWAHSDKAWMSKVHDDGSIMEGWFIAGIVTPEGNATYHLPIKEWDDLYCNRGDKYIMDLDKAPKWDGHTPADVIERLKIL